MLVDIAIILLLIITYYILNKYRIVKREDGEKGKNGLYLNAMELDL